MRIAIRVDASEQIGMGHVMRTLTLAHELKKKGAEVSFVSRELPGNLCGFIESQGFFIQRLPSPQGVPIEAPLAHSHWLGVDWSLDAEQTSAAIRKLKPHWLVVDHYALDKNWESNLRSSANKIMVIDDLADRPHDCDLLVDQNLYDRLETRYQGLISAKCETLLGPDYALLREEFKSTQRQLRPRDGSVRKIFIFFGGVDPSRETEKALRALSLLKLENLEVDVIVGKTNPARENIQKFCAELPHCHFHSQVTNISQFMREADLALGGGGTTTWERLCLGLPSIVISIAENQEKVAECVAKTGGQIYLGKASEINDQRLAAQIRILLEDQKTVKEISAKALRIVDGLGTERVSQKIQAGL